MTPIPFSQKQFHEQLKAFSHSDVFTGYLIVNEKNGELTQTHVIRSLWEKFKGALGLQDWTNKSLVEFKTIDFLLKGKSWLKTPEDIRLVKTLATRVGLTPNGTDHQELQELVNELSTPSFSSTAIAKENLLERFVKNHPKDLSPFPPEILKITQTFNRVITPDDNENSAFTSEEEHAPQDQESEFSSKKENEKTLVLEDDTREPLLIREKPLVTNEVTPSLLVSKPSTTPLPSPIEDQVSDSQEAEVIETSTLPSKVEVLTPLGKNSRWTTAAKVALVATASFVAITAGYYAWQYFTAVPENTLNDPFSHDPIVGDPLNTTNPSNTITETISNITSYFSDRIITYYKDIIPTSAGDFTPVPENFFNSTSHNPLISSPEIGGQIPSIIDTLTGLTTTVKDAIIDTSVNPSDFFTPLDPFHTPLEVNPFIKPFEDLVANVSIGEVVSEETIIPQQDLSAIISQSTVPTPYEETKTLPIQAGSMIDTIRYLGLAVLLGVAGAFYARKKKIDEDISEFHETTPAPSDKDEAKLFENRLLGINNFSGVACYQNAALKSLFHLKPFVALIQKEIQPKELVKRVDESESNFERRTTEEKQECAKKEELRLALLALYNSLNEKYEDRKTQIKKVSDLAQNVSELVFASGLHAEFYPAAKGQMQDSSAFIELFLGIFDYQLMEKVTNTGATEGKKTADSRAFPSTPCYLIQLPLPKVKVNEKNNLQSLINQNESLEIDELAPWRFKETATETIAYPQYFKTTVYEGTPPDLLVVQLKRGNAINEARVAIEDKQELEFPESGFFDFSNSFGQKDPLNYHMQGFIYRFGATGTGGHYQTYLKEKGGWICYDGSKGTPVSEGEAKKYMAQAYIFLFEKAKPSFVALSNHIREKHPEFPIGLYSSVEELQEDGHPFHFAVEKKDQELYDLLLKAGGDPQQVDFAGRDPHGKSLSFVTLSDYVRTKYPDFPIDQYTSLRKLEEGQRPFHFAVEKNDLQLFDLLMEAGGDPFYSSDDTQKLTSLFDEITDDNRNSAIKLLHLYGDYIINAYTEGLLYKKTLEAIDTLVARGLNIDSQDSSRKTLLFKAVVNHNLQLVQYLISKGAQESYTISKNDQTEETISILDFALDEKARFTTSFSKKKSTPFIKQEPPSLNEIIKLLQQNKSKPKSKDHPKVDPPKKQIKNATRDKKTSPIAITSPPDPREGYDLQTDLRELQRKRVTTHSKPEKRNIDKKIVQTQKRLDVLGVPHIREEKDDSPISTTPNPLEGYDLQTELRGLLKKLDSPTLSNKEERQIKKKAEEIKIKLDILKVPHVRDEKEDLDLEDAQEQSVDDRQKRIQ